MKRAKSLGLETKAIAEQQAKIKAELAAAAKKAAEEKAALKRALKNHDSARCDRSQGNSSGRS